ncbi:hypothetical protein GCM10007857_44710 [Bradyrhizobium iriomotense]|uniref:Uncharacterized protein n=1 Tax=Bradyrhizobium iriomotense TaxID=441950 RepID=A0ABQ6B4D4_9BRAD|nr:hypothetical protein GCM10007857_44710 [Bradyrhizobium iriomotense]
MVPTIPEAMPACASETLGRLALSASGMVRPWPKPLKINEVTSNDTLVGAMKATSTDNVRPIKKTLIPSNRDQLPTWRTMAGLRRAAVMNASAVGVKISPSDR